MDFAPTALATRSPSSTRSRAGGPFCENERLVGQIQPMPPSIVILARAAWSFTFCRYAASLLS
jgi:hypothetical protein